MRPDYYRVLGVSVDAPTEEIRRAYRARAKEWHPDVNAEPDAAEQFRLARQAYEVLGDPQARAAYDRETRAPAFSFDPFGDWPFDHWPMGERSLAFDLLGAIFGDPPVPRRAHASVDPHTEVIVDDLTGAIRLRRRSPGVRIQVTWRR